MWFGPAEAVEQWAGLSVLITGRVQAGHPSVQHFLEYVQANHLSLEQLWVAREGERIGAAVLILPCAGRTALVFVCPVAQRRQVGVVSELLRRACAAQDREKLHLLQALLDPDQVLAEQAVKEAGFWYLAELVYLQRVAQEAYQPLQLPAPLTYRTWSPAYRPLFAQAILASYEQTQDCPGLRGLRDIEDIIDGHMACGEFVPELWYLLQDRERPVGVMLLNPVPGPGGRRALELVYLGLAPAYRGRGLGTLLLRHAISLPSRYGGTSVVCALDRANRPAAALYQRMGFVPTTSKRAFVLSLREPGGQPQERDG